MSRNVAVIGDVAGGSIVSNVVPGHVNINGLEVALTGALIPPHLPIHPAGSMIGTSHVKVNGVELVGNGDPAVCGHVVIATGFVQITP